MFLFSVPATIHSTTHHRTSCLIFPRRLSSCFAYRIMASVAFIPAHFCALGVSAELSQLTKCCSRNSRLLSRNSQKTNNAARSRERITVSDLQISTSSGNSGPRPPDRGFRNRPGDDESSFYEHASPFMAYALYLLSMRRNLTARRSKSKFSSSPSFRNIRVSHMILALNVVVFLYQTFFAPTLLMAGAKVNSSIITGQYYRLLSAMFLHASTTHLMINSFSLHSTGPSVESWFGKKRFLALYLLSGLCGNVLSLCCTPTPAVGASGAIFGLVGASAVLLARHRDILGPRSRRALQSLVYIVVMNFGLGLTPGSRIDNFGHLGGFMGGIAYSYLFGPRLIIHRRPNGRSTIHDDPILNAVLREFRLRLSQLRRLVLPQ